MSGAAGKTDDRRAVGFVVFGHDPDRLELSRLHELRHDDGQHRARRLWPFRHLRRRILDQRRLHPAARQRSRRAARQRLGHAPDDAGRAQRPGHPVVDLRRHPARLRHSADLSLQPARRPAGRRGGQRRLRLVARVAHHLGDPDARRIRAHLRHEAAAERAAWRLPVLERQPHPAQRRRHRRPVVRHRAVVRPRARPGQPRRRRLGDPGARPAQHRQRAERRRLP